jgi:hypothetical protein
LTNSELSENIFSEEVYKMYGGRLIFDISVVALVYCLGQSNGEGLEAKVAVAKLPTPLRDSTAVYDGNDYVYIFGGLVTETLRIIIP